MELNSPPTRHPDHEQPWAVSAESALTALSVDADSGLDASRVAARRASFGWNQMQSAAPREVWAIIAHQFRSVVVLLLAFAAGLAVAFGEHAEGLAILAVIVLNGAIGFVTEWRATRSMEALGRLGQVEAVVLRDGVTRKLPAEQLVPGDIVLLEGGDVIPADIRLIEAAKLQADESALTGESLPVSKRVDTLPASTRLADRINMVFKGTALTRGSGRGVVVSIGHDTELGRISNLVITAQPQQTPLEQRLNSLGARLAWMVIGLAVIIAIAGIAAGRQLFLAIEIAVALAVAAIPEGLPIVATIALARGMWRMARRNAVIARLSAVEALGETTVIFTDKTGTLTENRMAVEAAWVEGQEFLRDDSGRLRARIGHVQDQQFVILDQALEVAALCSNASVRRIEEGEIEAVGDPTEVALLSAALARGIERHLLVANMPEIVELPFDPAIKLMATLHRDGDEVLFAVKGAPEAVIPKATTSRTEAGDHPLDADHRREWLRWAHRFGKRGLRTIAVASKRGRSENEDVYDGLTLLAIFGLEDPPRSGVREAVHQCLDAGVSVAMVTGDHAATARNIAAEIGVPMKGEENRACVEGANLDHWLSSISDDELTEAAVFSRVTPEQKLQLIERYQSGGHVVAMTGDGVNDAPALKKADIGVAMGIRGTDVAREAAAMVLLDDEFSTIVEAMAQGRAIYGNIRKFVVYLLSCNISEVLIVTLATAAGAPLPLLPLQILFLNLVTDVFPALALGVGEGSPQLMKRPPRPPKEPLLTRGHWIRIFLQGAVIASAVLAAMAVAIFELGFEVEQAVTISFCTLAFAQLWHVFDMREDVRQFLDNEITRNVWVWAANGLCISLILLAIHIPLLSGALALQNPGLRGWAVILPLSFVPVLVAPLVRRFAQPASASS